MIEVKLKQLSEGVDGPLAVHHDSFVVVEPFEQKLFERGVSRPHQRAESRQALRQAPHIFDTAHA